MKHLKNIMAFISLWSIAYYFGAVEFAAYDNIWNYKDFLAIGGGVGGMYWLYRKYS